MGRAGPHGPELRTGPCGGSEFRVGGYVLRGVAYRGSAFMDVDVRLEQMDRLGIDLQVLSPNPLTYFHHVDPDVAASFCRWHNDEMARVVAGPPDRLRGFAQLPMQDPEAAVAELRRAVLGLGLLGPYVGTDFGLPLDDSRLDALYATCVELDVPLFVHPASPGIDGPLPDPRVRRFDMDLWLSFLYEETMAVATLVFGGVLDRHPALDVCLSHGGGAVAFLAGRLRHAARTRPWSHGDLRADGGFDRRLARLWFDDHVHDEGARALLLDLVGPERLVTGTNFAGWDAPHERAELPTGERAERLATNARRLLRLGEREEAS